MFKDRWTTRTPSGAPRHSSRTKRTLNTRTGTSLRRTTRPRRRLAPIKRFRKSTRTTDENTLIVKPSHAPFYTVTINLKSLFIGIVKLTGEVAQRLQLEIAVMEADQPALEIAVPRRPHGWSRTQAPGMQ